MKELVLTARNIVKWIYDPEKRELLHKVSLQIRETELVCLYGESGSGKTTLLYILGSIDTDFEGELTISTVSIEPKDGIDYALFRREHIGFVFQTPLLLPEFNVLDNVCLPAWKKGFTNDRGIKEYALELLDEVGLSPKAYKSVSALSGGEQQRISVARALINNPKVILADEPTGNLDSKNSVLVFELFKRICDKYKTAILMASHDVWIRNHADRAYEMRDGYLT